MSLWALFFCLLTVECSIDTLDCIRLPIFNYIQGSFSREYSRLSYSEFQTFLLLPSQWINIIMSYFMEVCDVKSIFAENLRKIREERGLSQKQLGKQMFVGQSTVARWENGSRLPDAAMMLRLADCLGVDVHTLLQLAAQSDESPYVIMVDDCRAILSDGLTVLEEVLQGATIMGFIRPKEAIDYAKTNRVALAILDIELGTANGLDLGRRLLEINPHTNIVFLTAYPDYALDAWETEASGFMVKPLTPECVKKQLKKLRYPFSMGGTDG